jgi:carboxyl-terminal processing protease
MKIRAVQNFILVLLIALLAGSIGYRLGTNNADKVLGLATNQKPGADLGLFWQVWNEVGTKYVDKTKLDSQKMVYGAISGMVAAVGDPYTLFLPPTQNKESKEQLNGSFEGIGAQLGVKDDKVVVVAPLPDSPAEKAGIRTADWILKVDGKDTTNLTLPEVVAKIRGPRGSQVALQILHDKTDKPVDIAVARDTIILKSVDWQVKAPGVVQIALARFGDQTDPQWDKVVTEVNSYLATSSAARKGVILDVRNNPGGFLVGAVYTASEFLPSGVIVKQQSYTGDVQTYSVNRPGKLLTVPMVVLINKGTASAGEILAGSLQAASRAKLVGEQSFGKGSVQEAEDLPNGAGLHVTTAKWLLSNDVWINGTGLTPDVKIENNISDPTKDAQLDKAVEILSKF